MVDVGVPEVDPEPWFCMDNGWRNVEPGCADCVWSPRERKDWDSWLT